VNKLITRFFGLQNPMRRNSLFSVLKTKKKFFFRKERLGSSSDPTLDGNLRYPNDIDRSLNEAGTDKIRKYRAIITTPLTPCPSSLIFLVVD
jgi:hypothetical protein